MEGASRSRPDVSTTLRYARHDKHRHPAFTLIELLVVISIVALLMAILFPVLQGARKRGQTVTCQGTLRQWGLYYSMYTAENNYRMPPLHPGKLFVPLALPQELRRNRIEGDPLNSQLTELHAYKDLILCPAARKRPADPGFLTHGSIDTGWVMDKNPMLLSSYGQNGWAARPITNRDAGARPTEDATGPYWVSCLVRGAAVVPVYLDCTTPYGRPSGRDRPPEYPEGTYDPLWGIMVYVMDRHQGGINSLFMDWSVRKVGLKELWTLKWGPDYNTAGQWTKAGGVRPEDWPPWMRRYRDY